MNHDFSSGFPPLSMPPISHDEEVKQLRLELRDAKEFESAYEQALGKLRDEEVRADLACVKAKCAEDEKDEWKKRYQETWDYRVRTWAEPYVRAVKAILGK